MEYNLNADIINVKSSTIVRMAEHFTVVTEKGPLDLKVDITADFAAIPPEYHEIFLNVLTAKYYNKVSFGQNSFSQCKPYEEIKWWEFWKKKWFNV